MVYRSYFIRGRYKSCGCSKITEFGTMSRALGVRRYHALLNSEKNKWVDAHLGDRFGRLIISGKAFRSGSGKYFLVRCKCDCGQELDVARAQLLKGRAKSCGCLVRDKFAELGRAHRGKFGESTLNGLFKQYKNRALKRGLVFSLTLEQFSEITSKDCAYCGSKGRQVSRSRGYGHYVYNGIDRIDNSKGYQVDNCVTCCKWCNSAKSDRKFSEFKDWAVRLSTLLVQQVVGKLCPAVKIPAD